MRAIGAIWASDAGQEKAYDALLPAGVVIVTSGSSTTSGASASIRKRELLLLLIEAA